MSSLEKAVLPAEAPLEPGAAASSWWDEVERALSRASEFLNPILVKEARQALRSKQFASMFLLTLAACWIWSMLGLAALGPEVYYSADGPMMFLGYYLILSFPLLISVPYSAFQSLSSERQDRTYELVSITTLAPSQIITGKLGGAVLQMMVYLSATFPCLAFTYLLRGLDIFTIIFPVLYVTCASLALCALALLLASLPAPRQRPIGSGVAFVVALVFSFFVNVSVMSATVSAGAIAIDSREFWIVNAALLTVFLNALALMLLAARAQLMTLAQNRSSALRVALVVAQMSFTTWCGYALAHDAAVGHFVFFSVWSWWFAGIFLTGEPEILSPRVKRDLPQSLLGRVFLSWFSPGPGTGYMFAVLNLAAALVMFNLPYGQIAARLLPAATNTTAAANAAAAARAVATRVGLWEISLVSASYMIIYLGIGRWILSVVGRYMPVTVGVRVLVHLVLVMLGSGVPWSLQMTLPALRTSSYTLLQITNPAWTIWEVCYKGMPVVGWKLEFSLIPAAIAVLVLSAPAIARELLQVRAARPPRVVEDDAAQAALAAPGAQRSSPWDER